MVKEESSGEDPRATGGLISNPPHPVNETQEHRVNVLGVGYSPPKKERKKTTPAQEWRNRSMAEHACSTMRILCFTNTK